MAKQQSSAASVQTKTPAKTPPMMGPQRDGAVDPRLPALPTPPKRDDSDGDGEPLLVTLLVGLRGVRELLADAG